MAKPERNMSGELLALPFVSDEWLIDCLITGFPASDMMPFPMPDKDKRQKRKASIIGDTQFLVWEPEPAGPEKFRRIL